ncbi:hypothetical protein [Nocardiopsis halophila]|uniref:hypothetical protein n=1 Tax=Nocardiopsis halophila TaxID=141692 RepID=UPI0003471549|nr:hypothetical protein [Nocardiopsis halophila]
MKPTRTITAAAGAAAVALAAGCGAGGGAAQQPTPETTGGVDPSPAGGTRDGGEAYVFNTHGDEQGSTDQEPQDLTASEFTAFNDLEWSEWGTERAVGEGDLSGTWCLPQCQKDPYRVPVELTDPEEFDGKSYFTAYEVGETDELPDEERQAMEEADGGRLMRP